MLLELQIIEDSYREQVQRQTQQKIELLLSKEQLYSSLKGNENRDILQTLLAPLEAKLRELEEQVNILQRTELNWNKTVAMKDLIKELSFTLEYKRITTEYSQSIPILMACKCKPDTNKHGNFKGPTFIVIEPETKQIYIGDEPNNRIQVFNQSCKFLYTFSTNMDHPAGMCFHNGEVLVTQHRGNCVNVYTIECRFLGSIGNKGNNQLQFKNPFGICSSKYTGTVYICEWGNNRVQVLNLDLSFNSFILGLFEPKAIQVTIKEIFVLDTNNPCIHVYNYEHELIRELISYGMATKQVSRSSNFCIDQDSNILITDQSICCVLIFNSRDGSLIYRFGEKGKEPGEFTDPRGITVTSEGIIIVSSSNPDRCIQFF